MILLLSDEVERMILEAMSSGKYASESELVKNAMTLLKERVAEAPQVETARSPSDLRDYLRDLSNIMKDVSEEELAGWPVDGSEQHDHYIYGTPKKS